MAGECAEYFHLPAGSKLPLIENSPRRVLVLIDQDVESLWQDKVSRWIVESGCLYMMAWGRDCITWDDSVDYANLERFRGRELPDDQFVMTTWHENDPLHEVFFFARVCAFHPTVPMPLLTILDIREEPRKAAILALYEAEKSGLLEDAFEDARELPFLERLKILMRKI